VKQFCSFKLSTFARLDRLLYAPVLALAMGLMFVRLLAMARMLDIPAFAIYSAGLLISSSFCMLACLGLQSLLQRALPMMIIRHRECAGGVLLMQCTLVAAACAFVAAVAAMVAMACGAIVAGLSLGQLVLALIHGLSQQLFLVATVDSRSRGQFLLFARQNLTRSLILLVASIVVAGFSGDAAAVLATEAVLSLLLSLWVLRQRFNAIPLRLHAAMLLALHRLPLAGWRSALALLGVASLGFLATNADRWLAAQQFPASTFAQYAFAWMVFMVAQSMQVVVNAALFPLLARRFARDGGLVAFHFSAAASLILLACSTVAALPLWVLLDYSIAKWFIPYDQARGLLPAFLTMAALRLSDFWSSYLIVAGRETRLLMLNVISMAIAAVLWWFVLVRPSVGGLNVEKVALLGLLLAAGGYAAAALAAWHYSKIFHKEVK
jgi:O-antigen/teichoic acid export membrane protein